MGLENLHRDSTTSPGSLSQCSISLTVSKMFLVLVALRRKEETILPVHPVTAIIWDPIWDGIQNTAQVIQIETDRELFLHLDCHKSMGPDEFHPRVLRELAAVLAEAPSAIHQRSWLSGEVPED